MFLSLTGTSPNNSQGNVTASRRQEAFLKGSVLAVKGKITLSSGWGSKSEQLALMPYKGAASA